jgi:hypothetical protein
MVVITGSCTSNWISLCSSWRVSRHLQFRVTERDVTGRLSGALLCELRDNILQGQEAGMEQA